MPTDSAKVEAMRERAKKKLAQERRSMSTSEKARLPRIQKRLAQKVRSSLPSRQFAPAAA